jgi:lipopolysaccharide/colanic/teichoic acid biosynthesis glycosyltransferase
VPRRPRVGEWAKRGFDLAFSGLGLIVSAPLWLLFAVAIKAEDRGPVFYRQQRVGRDGRPFEVLKFRTLRVRADEVVRPWMVPDSTWVTRVGVLLRRTALDELPQILNIAKGDMSVVGPRAMPVDEFETYRATLPGLPRRLEVRPGLTGIAQVYGKATRDVKAKLRYDLLYVRRHNLRLDLKLVALSFWISFRGKWESNGAAGRRGHRQRSSQDPVAPRGTAP